ncbi:MAG TPA: patatin-like phospholipase family protein [Chitinophagaceae bacterium]|nr:patatin-like phospholipase family protein [Chitinophagaceae bacterium]
MNENNKPSGITIAFILRNLFRSVWLFFPGIFFLFLTFFCFGFLPQGQDLMILSSEHSGNFSFFLCALCFIAVIAWLGAREIANLKRSRYNDFITPFLFKHIPRFIGFSFFTVLIACYIKTPLFSQANTTNKIPGSVQWLILFVSPLYYWVSTWYMERRIKKITFNWLFFVVLFSFFAITAILCTNLKADTYWLIFIILLLSQWAYLVLVITRRKIIDTKSDHLLAQNIAKKLFYFLLFIALAVYISCAISVSIAVRVTSFPFVLLAFSLFMCVGYLLSYFSIKKELNIHIVILFFVFLFGLWSERHFVYLKKNSNADFKKRADLEQYFKKWIESRKDSIDKYNDGTYPVYFVLSDGGASRSGYWVASVLSYLQDNSKGEFGKKLFCLSGASGGSLGNAAFYMLLRKMANENPPLNNNLYLTRSTEYLKSDFLTYTLSRMLGYDFFIQLYPWHSSGDRGEALAEALESAPDDSVFLKKTLDVSFSELSITEKNINDSFPIICINTTRMQDGHPSVISNINISKNEKDFNYRIDVLDILQPEKDIKLSTAIVLGASFPYISPAGRIDKISKSPMDKDSIRENYFVDGGYIDNSGAGIVHEMILQLNKIIETTTDSVLKKRMKKLAFTVIHITNGLKGDIMAQKVNPLINDLAAPLKTLIGTFSVQTTVNDNRLKNYMESFSKDRKSYLDINLYENDNHNYYPINWVISQHILKKMDDRLKSNKELKYLLDMINGPQNQ